jgi:structural maintenance of chromosome 1
MCYLYSAVTLEGTVIHRNGLITGGESVGSAKQWEERELQGMYFGKTTLFGTFSIDITIQV